MNVNAGTVVTLTGQPGVPGDRDGSLKEATFNMPGGICMSHRGDTLYVCDINNNRVRKVDLLNQRVSTIAGSREEGFGDGTTADALFRKPSGIAVISASTAPAGIFAAVTASFAIAFVPIVSIAIVYPLCDCYACRTYYGPSTSCIEY